MADSDSDCVPVFAEYYVDVNCQGWQAAAVYSLKDNGFCVLRGAVQSDEILNRCAVAAEKQLEYLIGCARARGFDIDTEEIRFKEIDKRIKTDFRYDISLPPPGVEWLDQPDEAKFPESEAAWAALYTEQQRWVWPVLQDLGYAKDETDGSSTIRKSGCVISHPGSSGQKFHPDGFNKGVYNVFLPLVPITAENGTQFQPGSHVLVDEDLAIPLGYAYDDAQVDPVTPCLMPGDVLMFDFRVSHRGLANTSTGSRPVAYFIYSRDDIADENYGFTGPSMFAEPKGA